MALISWPHIPADLLEALLCDARASGIPYEAFGDAQWRAFLAALDTAPARAEDERAFSLAPDFVLDEALARGVESPALFTSIWRRAPDRAGAELVRALQSPEADDLPRLRGLLETAPAAEFTRLSELFSQPDLSNLEATKLACVRRFLHQHIRARRAGYVEAYVRLAEIERQLSHAR